MRSAEIAEILREIDASIRKGETRRAAIRITEISKSARNLPRRQALELAALARRAYVPQISIQLLRPWVRPSSARFVEAEPEEKIEFAASLIQLGARSEGRELLNSVDHRKFPERDLFASFALFSVWDYGAAIPLLRRYCEHAALSDYSRLVAKANLAAALVHEKCLEEARALLTELEADTRAGGFTLLLQNVLKLEAERSIYAQDFVRAESYLQAAHELSGKSPLDDLYLDKWRAIAKVSRCASVDAILEMRKVRQRAHDLSEWEAVRDLARISHR